MTETLRKMLRKTKGAALSGLSSIGAPLPPNLISSHIQPLGTPAPLEIVFIVSGRGYWHPVSKGKDDDKPFATYTTVL